MAISTLVQTEHQTLQCCCKYLNVIECHFVGGRLHPWCYRAVFGGRYHDNRFSAGNCALSDIRQCYGSWRVQFLQHRQSGVHLRPPGTTRLLQATQSRKLQCFRHVVATAVLFHCTLRRIEKTRRRWTDDIKECTGSSMAECTTAAQNRAIMRTMVSLTQIFDS